MATFLPFETVMNLNPNKIPIFFLISFMQSTHDRSATNSSNANTSSNSGGEQSSGGYTCPAPDCGRVYKLKSSLRNHQKWECGKDPQFQCPFCVYRAKQKMHIGRHMERMHKNNAAMLKAAAAVVAATAAAATSIKREEENSSDSYTTSEKD